MKRYSPVHVITSNNTSWSSLCISTSTHQTPLHSTWCDFDDSSVRGISSILRLQVEEAEIKCLDHAPHTELRSDFSAWVFFFPRNHFIEVWLTWKRRSIFTLYNAVSLGISMQEWPVIIKAMERPSLPEVSSCPLRLSFLHNCFSHFEPESETLFTSGFY